MMEQNSLEAFFFLNCNVQKKKTKKKWMWQLNEYRLYGIRSAFRCNLVYDNRATSPTIIDTGVFFEQE